MSMNKTICISCHAFKCSGRGLILPFGIEACIPIPLRATLYFIFLLYLFLGIAIIADIFMSSIETITSKKKKIHYPDPNDSKKFIDVEIKIWNDTVANLTLMALGSSSPEILLSIIEIVGNRFESGDLGPGTIVGSAAYNLLIISAICISAIPTPDIRRIRMYSVFMITSFFGFFAYIWLFLVVSVISPDVIDLWEAIITLLMFPLVVLLAFAAEKGFFLKRQPDMEEEEEKMLESSLDNMKFEDYKSDLLSFLKEIGQTSTLTLKDKAELFAAKLSEKAPRSRSQYFMQGTRMFTGGKSLFMKPADKILELSKGMNTRSSLADIQNADYTDVRQLAASIRTQDAQGHSIIEFSSTSYAVLESQQYVELIINRHGLTNIASRFRLDTIDGTATEGEDYIKLAEEFEMQPGETEKRIRVIVIDDNQWEPDETFFVKMSLRKDNEDRKTRLGTKTVALVTIINDDEPGTLEFDEAVTFVKESAGKAVLKVIRSNGADGRISVRYQTKDIDAVGTKDYISVEKELVFEHGEISKLIEIVIIDDDEEEQDESFSVELVDPQGGAKLGKRSRTVVTIINDDEYKSMAGRMFNLVKLDIDRLSVSRRTWTQQFYDALNVNGGDLETATLSHYIGHVIAIFWKVLFAFVPPTQLAGGWCTFIVSLIFIGVLTALVGDVAAIFGCLVGLKDSVTAISLVAMGTSLPDTFASMIAAKNSKTADDAIGNITGSNSVNVFLGLGLPWVLAAIYWESKNLPFTVKAGDLSFSVMIFSICCIISMAILILRRFLGVFGKAELGGTKIPKYVCSVIFILLWIIYIGLSCLQAYGYIKWSA